MASDREIVERVRDATDLLALVGQAVKLRKQGSAHVGLCPFHAEKTPSFYINPQRGSYHCYGCGAGGTAIRFLMEHDGLQFMDAVKRLADAANIQIQEEFDANAERTGIPGLLRRLDELGVGYKDLHTEQSSLEEIFVSLVSERQGGRHG